MLDYIFVTVLVSCSCIIKLTTITDIGMSKNQMSKYIYKADGSPALNVTMGPTLYVLEYKPRINFSHASDMIGEYLVVDPTVEKEACSCASIVVAVTTKGITTEVFKIGEGSFHPHTVCDAVKVAKAIGTELNEALHYSSLKKEESLGIRKTIYGFLK